MGYPAVRLRRLRQNAWFRELVRETQVSITDFVAPLFVVPGHKVKTPLKSLPGQYQLSVDTCVEQVRKLVDLGVRAVLLFGIPEIKDEIGSSAWDPKGIIQQTIRAIKAAQLDCLVITDLCFCEYTSHGHCGILSSDGKLDNDATLEIISKQTLSHAEAGADLIAPSGMIDGTVGWMRSALDHNGYQELPILAYSAKYASSFYGPFREAAQSAPSHGDRKAYQMDPANIREALREVELDLQEGADIIMVKPALAYLDVIHAVKSTFNAPLAAYNVSGEYAMIKAAGANGWIDQERVMLEVLTSIKRAGADILISYFAEDFAAAMA